MVDIVNIFENKIRFLNGKHTFKNFGNIMGDFSFDGRECFIIQKEIYHLLLDYKIQTLNNDEIGWKLEDIDVDKPEGISIINSERYKRVDMSYPPIVIKNGPNPKNKLYRLIDGTHRMFKMKIDGTKQSNFYVLEKDEIINYLHDL